MSEQADIERKSDTIPHESLVENVIRDELDGGEFDTNVAIDDLDALTGGQAPDETEHNLVVTAVNDILAALRKSGIIPTE